MAQGTVKFFDHTWGFITADDGNDVFFRWEEIQTDADFKKIDAGARVEFEVGPGRDGPEAKNIVEIK